MKNLIFKLKKENKTSLAKLSIQMGKDRKFLSQKLNAGTLKVTDLKKCLECCGAELVVKYNGEEFII
jgi:hypothetical protein